MVFLDYLTQWVEAFATPDQFTEMIVFWRVRYSAPMEHQNVFCQTVIQMSWACARCKHLSIKKMNTFRYHAQINGLLEKFNSNLIGMISKVTQSSHRDWDRHLPYLLFAYCATVHESTRESPFFLLYGRDPCLPLGAVMNRPTSPYMVDSLQSWACYQFVACLRLSMRKY